MKVFKRLNYKMNDKGSENNNVTVDDEDMKYSEDSFTESEEDEFDELSDSFIEPDSLSDQDSDFIDEEDEDEEETETENDAYYVDNSESGSECDERGEDRMDINDCNIIDDENTTENKLHGQVSKLQLHTLSINGCSHFG